MPQCSEFQLQIKHPDVEPSHVFGPVPFLNPTRAKIDPGKSLITTSPKDRQDEAGIADEHYQQPEYRPPINHLWRSRDNRKGRHAISVPSQPPAHFILPGSSSTLKAVGKGLWRMATWFPYWDISYLVAVTFTLGSVIWVINAFFVWLPLADPQSTFSGESFIGGGVTACIGATIFELGSVLLLLEAVNENQTACFGWAVETALKRMESDGEQRVVHVKPNVDDCHHHHSDRKTFLAQKSRKDSIFSHAVETRSKDRAFKWLPSIQELRSHYLSELGFLASLVQFVGATIFWIAGITGVPGIINHMSPGLTDGVYWAPQMVGGLCFVLSGLLFTLETQPKWYIPAPRVLGWHIGAWNFIGGIGFTLCGCLGPASGSSGVAYQATLATFWGSWAFLIGSTIQWYESLQKHPVEVTK